MGEMFEKGFRLYKFGFSCSIAAGRGIKMERKLFKIISVFFIIIIIFNMTACAPQDIKTEVINAKSAKNQLSVNYIDVGQGDSALIITPNGKTMLIDGGGRSEEDRLLDYLDKREIRRLDVIVGTHPHEDHIGGLIGVIKNLDVGEIYMPKASSNSNAFRDLLLAIKNKGLKINTAKQGLSFSLDQDVVVEIISPGKEYDDLNNMSVVLKVSYKNTSFLFMGDAEKEVERDLMQYITVSDVIKIGHHGSSTSSGKKFIEKINPTVAIISCGKDNDYGHPHRETLELLKDQSIKLYRTDQSGNISASSDGNKINFTEEKE